MLVTVSHVTLNTIHKAELPGAGNYRAVGYHDPKPNASIKTLDFSIYDNGLSFLKLSVTSESTYSEIEDFINASPLLLSHACPKTHTLLIQARNVSWQNVHDFLSKLDDCCDNFSDIKLPFIREIKPYLQSKTAFYNQNTYGITLYKSNDNTRILPTENASAQDLLQM